MEEPIDILALVRRYRFLIAINLFLAIGFFVGLAFILPPKYKSSGTLTIFSKYFQNPLVRDFLPELTDAIELRAQRENLIRQCFTEDYLNQLGTKFGLFRSSDETQEHLNELEALRKNIEIFPVGATTFTVGFKIGRAHV